MPSMQRPEAMPWPTPDPIAARPMAKPAPTAESAGIQTPSPSAYTAVGVASEAALSAAVGKDWIACPCAGCLGAGAATKLRVTLAMSMQLASKTAASVMAERGAAIWVVAG